MYHRSILSIIVVIAMTLPVVSAASADSKSSDRAVIAFETQNTASVDILAKAHNVQNALAVRLAFYREMNREEIGRTTDLLQLRAQLLRAQRAVEIAQQVADSAAVPQAQVDALTNALGTAGFNGLLYALQTPNGTMRLPVSNGHELALLDSETGTAPKQQPGNAAACPITSYLTGTYATASTQFTSSTSSVGHKNTLSLIGFAIGVVPVALNCIQPHSANNS